MIQNSIFITPLHRLLQTQTYSPGSNFWKHNPNSHYCNAIYNFIKQRALKHSPNSTFSADCKCKISVGEPDFLLACAARGKKVIIGHKKSFQVANHDFSKISIITAAVFVQQIPEENDSEGNEFNIDTDSWFSDQVYYGFKNMVTQSRSAICGVTGMGEIIETERINVTHSYAITDGGGDWRVEVSLVQKSIVGLFLYDDFYKVLICRTAASLSYCSALHYYLAPSSHFPTHEHLPSCFTKTFCFPLSLSSSLLLKCTSLLYVKSIWIHT